MCIRDRRKSEALKCLNVIEMFRASEGRNKPEWMVLKVLPVIPQGAENGIGVCGYP